MITKIYVGGLSYDLNNQDLKTMFMEFGTVVSSAIIKDRDSHKSKGFGFIEMSSKQAQEAIYALNNKEVNGRRLIVNVARPKSSSRSNNDRSDVRKPY